jgi:predicted P-loop ATPase
LPKAWEAHNDLTRKQDARIIELRMGGGGKGSQSVMPGSLHTSGELYEWAMDGEPTKSAYAELSRAVMKIGVGVMLLRHWPPKGTRHESVLVLGGFLARAGWQPAEVDYFVETICTVHGEADDPRAHAKTAEDSAERHQEGGNVYGMPKMIEYFGESVAKGIANIMKYREAEVRYVTAEGFEKDGRGILIKNSQKNIRKAMELMGITVRYDAFHDQMLISGLENFTTLDDAAVERLWLLIDERFHLLPTIEFFFTVVQDTARYNSFHPVRDYLDNLVWDGIPRIDRWLVTYGGAEDTEYVRAVGSITLIAAVRRIRQPGVKFDEMLILESPQGLDKSEMLRTVAINPEWFIDDLPLDADSKKVIEQLRGRWIVEAAELSGMKKGDVEHLKAMLSRQVDRARLAYGRVTVDVPRQCIIVGTTNATAYLKDETGNRRFWPVKIKKFDVAGVARDRDQLWAEAAHREASGASIRLEQSLWSDAAEQQQQRTIDDPWFEVMRDAIGDKNGKISATDAWIILDVRSGHRNQESNRRLGHIMKALGFERTRVRFNREMQYGYARGTANQRERVRLRVTVTEGVPLVATSKARLKKKAKKVADSKPL